MPGMLRTSKRADVVAWKILPKPANMTDKKTKRQREVDQRLNVQWIQRAR